MTNATDTQTPPVTDPRPALGQAIGVAADVISSVRAEHLGRPTPCDAMTVSDLLSHLVMVAERIGAAADGIDPQHWPASGPELAVTEWADAFRIAGDAAVADWARDDSVLARPTALPWTTLPGADALAIYVNELVVHTWDLATAIDTPAVWSDEVLAVAGAAIHSELPDPERVAMWEALAAQMPEGIAFAAPFGDAVPIADDASVIDRLIAWNGRSPQWPTPSAAS